MRTVSDTVEEAIETAKGDIAELSGEMESWRDGLQGTNLENSEKFNTIEDAMNQLQQGLDWLEGAEVPERYGDKKITYTLTSMRKASRAVRLDNAVSGLRVAMEELDGLDDTDDCVSMLDSAINDLDSVEFPGMYG